MRHGLLVLPGASRASLNAMPRFTYLQATIERAQFIHATSMQLARANAQLARLQKNATTASGTARVQLGQDHATFQADISAAVDKLADLEKAEAARYAALLNQALAEAGNHLQCQ